MPRAYSPFLAAAVLALFVAPPLSAKAAVIPASGAPAALPGSQPGVLTAPLGPTLTVFASPAATPTHAATISFDVVFSENVIGLSASDFSPAGTATGCSINQPVGSGSIYTVDVTGCSEGSLVLVLAANAVIDPASRSGPATDSAAPAVTIDRTPPSANLSCSTPSPTNRTVIACTVAFSEALAGGSAFTSGDVALSGTSTAWTVGTPTGTGPFAFNVTQGGPAADGRLSVQVRAGAIADAAGNPSTASAAIQYVLDRTLPTIAFHVPASPASQTVLDFGLSFSEAVTGLTSSDIAIGGTSSGWSVSGITGSGASYTVTIGAPAPTSGSILLSLRAGAVTDAAGNVAPAASAAAGPVSWVPGTVTRLYGSNRFATAAAISAATFMPGVDVAYIAYAFDFPDGLAGAAAAGTIRGPVLLAASSLPLDAATASELARVKPKRIVVLGGPGAVNDAVKGALSAYTTGTVTRLAGADRFGTAAAVSAATFAAGVDVAYIAYAYNFPDALAGAAAAGTIRGPVLLADTVLPINPATSAELARLKPKRIVVLGGSSVIGDALKGALGTLTAGAVTRIAGPDRFATAAAISAATFKPGVVVAYIANGRNFPDALAGAAAAGTSKGPVLLADTGVPLNPATSAELARLKPGRIVVLGGPGVISDGVVTQLLGAVPTPYLVNTYNGLMATERPENYTCVSASAVTWSNYVRGITSPSSYSHTVALAWYSQVRSSSQDFHDKYDYTSTGLGLDSRGWAWLMFAHAPTGYGYHDYWSTSQSTVNGWMELGIRTTYQPVGAIVFRGIHAVDVVGFIASADPLRQPSSLDGFFIVDPWYPNATNVKSSGGTIGLAPNTYLTLDEWNSQYFKPYVDPAYESRHGNTIWHGAYVTVLRAADGTPEPTPAADAMPPRYSDAFLGSAATSVAASLAPAGSTLADAPALDVPVAPLPEAGDSLASAALQDGLRSNHLDTTNALGIDLRNVTIGRRVTVDGGSSGVQSYDLVEVERGGTVLAIAMLSRRPDGLRFAGIQPVYAGNAIKDAASVRQTFKASGIDARSLRLQWDPSADSLSPFSPLWVATDAGGGEHRLTPIGEIRSATQDPGADPGR